MSKRLAQQWGSRQRMTQQQSRKKRVVLPPSVLDTSIGRPIELPTNEDETWLLLVWRINETIKTLDLTSPRVTKVEKKIQQFSGVCVVDCEKPDTSWLKVEVQGFRNGQPIGADMYVEIDHEEVKRHIAAREQAQRQRDLNNDSGRQPEYECP